MRRSSKLAEHTRLETWVFTVKWQSSVTPKFLTESDKETDAQPTAIKSGKWKERDLDFRPEDMIIASVLSLLSLSLFNIIQDLMSSIHFCIERKRSGIWWGGKSAFQLQLKEELHRERRGQVQGLIHLEHRKRWELAQSMDADRLSAVCRVGWKPIEGCALYSEIMMKPVK